jgi:hypothetical protein
VLRDMLVELVKVRLCVTVPAWCSSVMSWPVASLVLVTTRSCTAQHDTAQHDTAQHDTAQNDTAQHDTAQHEIVRWVQAVCRVTLSHWRCKYGEACLQLHINSTADISMTTPYNCPHKRVQTSSCNHPA